MCGLDNITAEKPKVHFYACSLVKDAFSQKGAKTGFCCSIQQQQTPPHTKKQNLPRTPGWVDSAIYDVAVTVGADYIMLTMYVNITWLNFGHGRILHVY